MDLTKPLPYFTIEKFSHHFVLKDISPMGQAAADAFARNYVQFGLEKVGRFWVKNPIKVFAAKVRAENEVRFHIGQYAAWKKFLANRGVSEACYKEVEYGFAEAAPLGAVLKEGWVAKDYQEPIIEYIKSDLPYPRKLVEIQTGKGKSQPGYSKVLALGGFIRMDEVVPGELLITQDGSVTAVEEVYENGLRPIFELKTEDGRRVEIDKEHLWRINYYQFEKLTQCVITTDHIRVLLAQNKNVYLPTLRPDKNMAHLTTECTKEAADACEGKLSDERLQSIELSGYMSRFLFLKNVLLFSDVDPEQGKVFLKIPKCDALQRVFWATGFYCRWDEELQSYDLWNEDIVNYFENNTDILTAVDARLPYYGVPITEVTDLDKKENSYCIKVAHPLHLYITDDYIVTHNTFCASAAVAAMGKRMIAFLKPKYIEKWISDLKEILDIDPEDIEVVRGSTSLMKVMSLASSGDLNCKAIIVSSKTYQRFISLYEEKGKAILDEGYDCLPHELIQHTSCGVRLIDEVHEEFHLNFKIDLYTHVPKSISLSATLVNRDPFLMRMYEIGYPLDLRYNNLDYDKYAHSYAFNYRINGGERIRTTEVGSQSYSHMAFEKSIISNKKLLAEYLSMIGDRVQKRYYGRKTEGQRCLVYAASILMCTLIRDYLAKRFSDIRVTRYVEDDPLSNLYGADLCVSTIGSAGTGHDIKNLIAVVLTVAISSLSSNIQSFGRLRKIEGVDVEFEYFTCLDIDKHKEYQAQKEMLLAERALSLNKETLSMALG